MQPRRPVTRVRRGSLTEELAAGFMQQQSALRTTQRPARSMPLLPRHRWMIGRTAEILGLGGTHDVEEALQREDNYALVQAFLGDRGPPTLFVFYQVSDRMQRSGG